jgi:hypothetical protein
VVAGRELYPVLAVAEIRRRGVPVRLIAFEGETREDLYADFPEQDRAMIKVGQLGHMLKALKRLDAACALMVGQITPGRLFRDLHPDAKALIVLATLKERNAETIFGAICREINKIGITVLDARSFVEDHLVTEGVMTGGKLKADKDHIEHGIRIAKEIARLDIGQGVVVRKGTVLSVESFEGTNDMLARANKYKTDKLIFVKTSRPNQNFNFDVPCFGMKTLEVMREAGVATACLEAGRTLILDKPNVLAKARELGIEIFGYAAR